LLFFTGIYRDFSVESIILGGVLIFSLLVHEYGHALTALYFGARPEITLEAFGGYAGYSSQGITPKQRFLITLNGPLLESLLIAISYYLIETDMFKGHPYIQYALYATMKLNILWCLLNLIPVVPLDGGYMAEYLLIRKFGDRGRKAGLVLGIVCSALAAPYLFFQGYFFFGVLLVIFGFRSYQAWQGCRGVQNDFASYLKSVEAVKNNDVENAKVLLKKLLKSKSAQTKASAAEMLAKLYAKENKGKKAYDLLLQADQEFLKGGKPLLCRLAFERGNYQLVGAYAQDVYAIDPSYEIALLNSKAFARLHDPAWSAAWLQTASQFDGASSDKIGQVLHDPAYDAVRGHEAFKEYAEKF